MQELAIIARRLESTAVRAQLETMVRRLAAEPAVQAAIGRRLTNAPVPARPVFQGREDDPRGAHGRVVDPVAYGQARDAVPPAPLAWPETADPDPTLSGRPIEPGESAIDWGNENMDWFFGDAIDRAQSQEALDRMIDRVRMEDGWGDVIQRDPDAREGQDEPIFAVPQSQDAIERFMRAQGANPYAHYKPEHRVPDEVVEQIRDAEGLSGLQKQAYVVAPDGHLYRRSGDPSYFDPEGTLARAREMQAHHAIKFNAPWDPALIDSSFADIILESPPRPLPR